VRGEKMKESSADGGCQPSEVANKAASGGQPLWNRCAIGKGGPEIDLHLSKHNTDERWRIYGGGKCWDDGDDLSFPVHRDE